MKAPFLGRVPPAVPARRPVAERAPRPEPAAAAAKVLIRRRGNKLERWGR